MTKRIKLALLLILLLWSSLASATCLTESEIPSSTPSNRFTDQGDGTVADSKTGLMWAKCAVGQDASSCEGTATAFNWQGALQAAESSILASHTDWRLPNIKELRSIVEQRCANPSINTDVFPGTPALHFWSASPAAGYTSYVWYVKFDYGNSSFFNYRDGHSSNSSHVRLVRNGQ